MSSQISRKELITQINHISTANFEELALKTVHYQATHNALYGKFLSLLGRKVEEITDTTKIPFLPIQLFKNYAIKTGEWQEEAIFESSGTTGQTPSKHYIRDLAFYKESSLRGFEHSYGAISNYCVLALLPSYLERKGSSLVAMVDHFIRLSKNERSGFFLHDVEQLVKTLQFCKKQKRPTLLIGVSFALLDLAEQYPIDLSGITIMETGGMKGRRKELTREELHATLKNAFNVESIHSEYGMTELLSQAYLKKGKRFYSNPTMKILIRDLTDPFSLQKNGRSGGVNIIDLANLDSCSFIATDDIGRLYDDGSFEILGRSDASDIRGCNLMISEIGDTD